MTIDLSTRTRKALEKEFKKTKKLFLYVKNVFQFDHIVKTQNDFRKRKINKTEVIFTIVFWAFLMRVESFNKLEQMIKYGCFKALFPKGTRMPSIDDIQRTLTLWDIESLRKSFKHVLSIIYKNKTFRIGTIDGYTPCAIDGTETIVCDNQKCDGCIEMKNENATRYVHKLSTAMVIGSHSNYVAHFSMSKPKKDKTNPTASKSEGELTVAKAILPELPHWIDVIVGDSLYFNAPFVKEILKSKRHAVLRLEDETRNIFDEINHYQAYHTCNDSFEYSNGSKTVCVYYWYKDTRLEDSTVTADDPEKYVQIRIYKFVEIIITNIKGQENICFREVYVGATDKNMPAKTAWTIMHKRWDIENTCFNQLKTYCNLEHCYTHNPTAIEAILYIMFMAFNICMSYLFRRLRNFRAAFEVGKTTIKWQIELIRLELYSLKTLINLHIIDYKYLIMES